MLVALIFHVPCAKATFSFRRYYENRDALRPVAPVELLGIVYFSADG